MATAIVIGAPATGDGPAAASSLVDDSVAGGTDGGSDAATAELLSDDPYALKLAEWRNVLAGRAELARPCKPPAPDRHKGREALRTRRAAAYKTAMGEWTALHVDWLAANDKRKGKRSCVQSVTRNVIGAP